MVDLSYGALWMTMWHMTSQTERSIHGRKESLYVVELC
jgi:hypothetical protein